MGPLQQQRARPAAPSRQLAPGGARPAALASAAARHAAGRHRGCTRRGLRALAAATAGAGSAPQQQQQQQAVLVKVCGITNAGDAEFAAQQGARLIGMIMWPKAKRAVSDATAAAIAEAAQRHGAQPVGVFVDEDAATIAARCRAAGISVAQLHGDASRACLNDLPGDLQVVYVLQADDAGQVVTPVPGSPGGPPLRRAIEWLLVDGMTGGSGKTFDWTRLRVPTSLPTRGWLLAGGLTPSNVAQAVATAAPTAVDVSSGVCGPDGLLKDRSKVAAFLAAAAPEAPEPGR